MLAAMIIYTDSIRIKTYRKAIRDETYILWRCA
jgi:hypothetical protein